jgi:peptide methionine sulfoxide reductase msrA/msrB
MHNPLTKQEKLVIIDKNTERPLTGEYDDFFEDGIYICKQCNKELFSSTDKFDSGCGWPSFDDELNNSITRIPDVDGFRTEIICSNCKAHLGHVFEGENLTNKNTRHCVNSISIKFIPKGIEGNIETIYLGGGCFWCIEAIFQKVIGITELISGYSGGYIDNPSYKEVCNGDTGHAEIVRVVFDKTIISLDQILQIFFVVHDPTSLNKQGADVGTQYRSIILYTTLNQKEIIDSFISKQEELKEFENKIVTEVKPNIKFYKAEKYHQDYYKNNPSNSYCRIVIDPKVNKFYKGFGELAKN